MAQPPAFLNKFPAGPVPTPRGNAGPGFIRNGPLDPGMSPGPVEAPKDIPGPIHMQAGWHQGPGVSVTPQGRSEYGLTEADLLEDARQRRDAALEQEIVASADMAAQQAAEVADKAWASAQWEAGSAVREAPALLPKMAGYAAVTALGFAAGRKFSPMMPIKQIRDSVPTAGALTGFGVATLIYKDSPDTIFRTMMMVAAGVVGAYAADMLYPRR